MREREREREKESADDHDDMAYAIAAAYDDVAGIVVHVAIIPVVVVDSTFAADLGFRDAAPALLMMLLILLLLLLLPLL